MASPVCPKCSALMEEGSIQDRSHLDRSWLADWVVARRKSGIFSWGWQILVRRRIVAYRCTACGYPECYGRDPKGD